MAAKSSDEIGEIEHAYVWSQLTLRWLVDILPAQKVLQQAPTETLLMKHVMVKQA